MKTTLAELNQDCVTARWLAEQLETPSAKELYKSAEEEYLFAEYLLGFVDINDN